MRYFKASLALSIASGVFALTVGVSRADTLTYTATIATLPAPFASTFTLPQFDASFGTLTGLSLSLTENSVISIQVANLNATTEPFSNAAATVPLTVTGPASLSVTATNSAGPFSGTIAGSAFLTLPGTPSTGTSSVVLPSSAFAPYIGSSSTLNTFTATAGAGTYSGTARTNILFGGAADVGGVATITYTFVAAGTAPEPGALALMGVGLAVGGVIARRRRA